MGSMPLKAHGTTEQGSSSVLAGEMVITGPPQACTPQMAQTQWTVHCDVLLRRGCLTLPMFLSEGLSSLDSDRKTTLSSYEKILTKTQETWPGGK